MEEYKHLPKLTVAEFEIMKVIWEQKEASVSLILNEINNDRDDELKRSTIRVQISRLMDKGWLEFSPGNKTKHYRATVPRGKASSLIASDVKERVFNGSCVELIRTLFKSSEISGKEMEEIRKLIDNQNK